MATQTKRGFALRSIFIQQNPAIMETGTHKVELCAVNVSGCSKKLVATCQTTGNPAEALWDVTRINTVTVIKEDLLKGTYDTDDVHEKKCGSGLSYAAAKDMLRTFEIAKLREEGQTGTDEDIANRCAKASSKNNVLRFETTTPCDRPGIRQGFAAAVLMAGIVGCAAYVQHGHDVKHPQTNPAPVTQKVTV